MRFAAAFERPLDLGHGDDDRRGCAREANIHRNCAGDMLAGGMNNEEALCEALIRLLEHDFKATRSDVTYPEKDGSGPPVEMRLRLGDRRVAIEHTLIEPFALAIRTGKEFGELTAEIEANLNGNMPKPGTYVLLFPVHPTRGKHRRTHAELREKISAWIVGAGKELHGECPDRKDRYHCPHGYHGSRSAEIDGIPLKLMLRVHWTESGRHDGALFLSRTVGEDVENLRLERMRTALKKKLPKLRDCAQEGDTTFLILEWSDIALSNHIVIAEALEMALEDRSDWPDYIFLADTATDQWHFFPPVIDGQFSIDMEYIDIERH